MEIDVIADVLGGSTPEELVRALAQIPTTDLLFIINNRVKDAERAIEDIEKILVNYKEDK